MCFGLVFSISFSRCMANTSMWAKYLRKIVCLSNFEVDVIEQFNVHFSNIFDYIKIIFIKFNPRNEFQN